MNDEPFAPSNALEDCLFNAATDPSARPQFYRMLLGSEIYFLTPNVPAKTGQRVLEADTDLALVHFQGEKEDFIPFFSSLKTLQQAVTPDNGYGFIAFNGKTAFDMLAEGSMPAVLNPGLTYGKEFLLDEMRQMADGSFFNERPTVISKDKQILLGQPKEYPNSLIKSLQNLFKSHPSVTAAYLAQMHDPSSDDPPHILIGIECPGHMQIVAPEAVLVAQEDTQRTTIVDFVEVGLKPGSINDYFKNQTQPFYKSEPKPRWKFW
ncbi:MAG: enhanced serine sensitivity protein SseB C-terminal domain-containing protein [Verrucomicrobiota bacterium]